MDASGRNSHAGASLALGRDPLFWLTIGLAIFAIAPFLLPGYFWGANDARHHVYFLFEYDRAVQDGIWWPRWSPDFAFGYGYPLFNIYAPLAIYAAEIIHLLGADMISAVKLVYIFATIGAGLAMYGFTRRLFGSNAGLLAGIA